VKCPLLDPENARHWCHRFAEAPPQVSRDARWDEWSRELGIDRRSLPYSHLVLSVHEVPQLAGFSRIIGVPREGKGHSKVLSCDASGLRELILQKRDAPGLYRALGKTSEYPPYRWHIAAGKITGPTLLRNLASPPDSATLTRFLCNNPKLIPPPNALHSLWLPPSPQFTAKYAGKCSPTWRGEGRMVNELAAAARCSPNAASRHLAELKKKGILTIKRRPYQLSDKLERPAAGQVDFGYFVARFDVKA
jgi:hypothetical protein